MSIRTSKVKNARYISAVLIGRSIEYQQPDGSWFEVQDDDAMKVLVCADVPVRLKPRPVLTSVANRRRKVTRDPRWTAFRQ